jgi:hypothetical protein
VDARWRGTSLAQHDGSVERAQALMENLRVLSQICITWWVSAAVVGASILGLSWSRRADIKAAGRIATHALFGMTTLFFLSGCSFGIAMIAAAQQFGDALAGACGPDSACLPSDADAITSAITIGVAIGTTTFFLFAVAWVIAWILTIHEEKRAYAARSAGTTPPRSIGRPSTGH